MQDKKRPDELPRPAASTRATRKATREMMEAREPREVKSPIGLATRLKAEPPRQSLVGVDQFILFGRVEISLAPRIHAGISAAARTAARARAPLLFEVERRLAGDTFKPFFGGQGLPVFAERLFPVAQEVKRAVFADADRTASARDNVMGPPPQDRWVVRAAAPALAAADVGLAMGTGTDVAIEAGDVVLMSGDPLGVADAVRISRATMRNIRQNLHFILTREQAYLHAHPSVDREIRDDQGRLLRTEPRDQPGLRLWTDQFSSIAPIIR